MKNFVPFVLNFLEFVLYYICNNLKQKNMQITKQLFEDVINGKLSGYFELRKGHQVASNMLFRCTSNEEYPYILNDLDSDEGDDLDLYDNNGFAATLGYEYDIVDFFEAPIYEYDDDIYEE